MKERYLFIGEQRSETAKKKDWTWESKRLSGKTLFEALREIGIKPEEHEFVNLWDDEGKLHLPTTDDFLVIGMGKKVQAELNKLGIKYIGITHPATRGKVRGKYAEQLEKELEKM